MTIDLNRIDAIQDYDEAIAALEEFVADLAEEFVESPEGKAYLTAHPEMEAYVGSWIDQLLYFGYAYRSVTLPRMTKQDVEAIVIGLFPQKVTLQHPDEADTTIPELIAFWQFLKRAYKHRNATQILKFLEKTQPKYKDIMNDPSRFGMAKSFVSAGMAAGFDMTTEAGLKAFQEQYNQQLREKSANAPAMPPGVPPGLGMLLNNLNAMMGNSSAPVPAEFQQLLGALGGEMLDGETGEEAIAPISPSDLTSPESFLQELQRTMLQQVAEELPPLSPENAALLTQQEISHTQPGTILRDFQTLLDFVGEAGVAVSGTHHLLPQKSLAELNQRLSEPIQLDLKRPVQKSYSPIHGLYLLLRATGLGQIVGKGKKRFLMLEPTLLQSWRSLNPTEQYFTLLEAWLIRGHGEMLGEQRSALNEGTKCIRFWPNVPSRGKKFNQYSEQQWLVYYPDFHNVALFRMFGLLEVESGKPEAGKGWRIKKIKRSPFGDALMTVVIKAFMTHGLTWQSETDPTISFGELQAHLQPYFPEWQHNLAVPKYEFRPGVYLFKVSLGKVWRRIAISSQMTLADLSSLILESVEFDSDHLDMFIYKNPLGRTIEVSHPYAENSPATDEMRIGDLPLAEGAVMTYVFDFGDWWEFEVQLEKIQPDDSRSDYGAIVERHGEAPPQYPDYDDEWDE